MILDVVYNHTAESDEAGPTLSFRGLDNASYYRLEADDPRRPVNDTGTGNTVNLSHPRVLQMVMDSLRYWVSSYHVDGFRFDLATTLGRERNGFDAGAGLLRRDPPGPGARPGEADRRTVGHRPGRLQARRLPARLRRMERPVPRQHPPLLARRPGQRPELAARLAGSADLFDRQGRRTWASVNFVACHDGFTLADAVAYERASTTRPTARTTATATRRIAPPTGAWRAARTTRRSSPRATGCGAPCSPPCSSPPARRCCWPATSSATASPATTTPTARTTAIAWLDWQAAEQPENAAFAAYVARLIALRRDHPVLRCPLFLHGSARTGATDPRYRLV